MWKLLVLGLFVLLHSRIFLISMYNYEARSLLFMIKTVCLYHVPRSRFLYFETHNRSMKKVIKLTESLKYDQIVLSDC